MALAGVSRQLSVDSMFQRGTDVLRGVDNIQNRRRTPSHDATAPAFATLWTGPAATVAPAAVPSPPAALQAPRGQQVASSPYISAYDPALARRERRLPWPSSYAVPPEARAAWFENPSYQRELDACTQSEAHSGNYVSMLIDGQASFAEKNRAIAEADAIFLKTYQLDYDNAGRRIAQELEDAARRGCKVFVQYGIKSFYNPWQLLLIRLGLKQEVPPTLQRLSKAPNATLVPNDRPHHLFDLVLKRDHEKYLITYKEGEAVKLIMGGMNFSDAWLHGGEPGACSANGILYRDTDVMIVGPTAKDIIQAFIVDMGHFDVDKLKPIIHTYGEINNTSQHVLYPSSGENAVVRFVRNAPQYGENGQYIKKMFLSLLKNVPSGERVRIANPYFLPTQDLQDALVRAANRGVTIEICINSRESPERESRVLARAGHSLFRKLLRTTLQPTQFRFYEFVGNPATGHNTMHHKVASFGDRGPIVVGSSNFDPQSFRFNRECCALIYGGQIRKAFDQMWDDDIYGRQDGLGNVIMTTRPLSARALREEPLPTQVWQRTLRSVGGGLL